MPPRAMVQRTMAERHGLTRGLGLLEATALNMSNMVGVGPFVTIPLLIGAMGGPQCLLGWAVGTVLALCDGLVWAELAAAMPGEGGSYLYLREAFRRTRLGTLLPFLFIWQFIFSGPLEIASGYIGFAQYLSYLRSGMGAFQMRLAVLVVGVLVIALLYRGIQSVGRLTVVLWIGMLATVTWILGAGFAHFDARRAFDFSPHAFAILPAFMAGLGGATLIAMYNFLGYYGICFVGGEVRRPERTMPRSIVLSVLLVGAMYALMTIAIMGVVPWREAAQSKFVAARFMETLYGPWAGRAVTVLILWAAGGSVLPLVIGGLAIAGGMLSLDWVVSAILTARTLIQFIGQIAAVEVLRKSRPEIRRPFRMWLYPLPSVLALAGWVYVFATSGWTFVLCGLAVLASGVVAFAVWRRWGGVPPGLR